MKIIKLKLEESLAKITEEIEMNESDIIWVENQNENTSISEYQQVQQMLSDYFYKNRVIFVSKGFQLKIDKG